MRDRSEPFIVRESLNELHSGRVDHLFSLSEMRHYLSLSRCGNWSESVCNAESLETCIIAAASSSILSLCSVSHASLEQHSTANSRKIDHVPSFSHVDL